jgi:hypothetical protein
LKKNVLIKTVTFHERASAIKIVLSCTGLAGKKTPKKPNQFQFYFFSEIGNFNIGDSVIQLPDNKKRPYGCDVKVSPSWMNFDIFDENIFHHVNQSKELL